MADTKTERGSCRFVVEFVSGRTQIVAQTFAPITVPAGFDPSYFQNYFVNNPGDTPDGPDADD